MPPDDEPRTDIQRTMEKLLIEEQEHKRDKALSETRTAVRAEEVAELVIDEQRQKVRKAESEARMAEALEEHVKMKIREDGDLTKLPKWSGS